jgi:hypothetical protein
MHAGPRRPLWRMYDAKEGPEWDAVARDAPTPSRGSFRHARTAPRRRLLSWLAFWRRP